MNADSIFHIPYYIFHIPLFHSIISLQYITVMKRLLSIYKDPLASAALDPKAGFPAIPLPPFWAS
jgi:hypothetical protein